MQLTVEERNRWVEANDGLVWVVARKMLRPGLSMDDLVQQGRIGLMRAVEGYEPREDQEFASYAVVAIRRTIRHLTDQRSIVRVPYHAAVLRKRLHVLMRDGLSLDEAVARLNMTPRRQRLIPCVRVLNGDAEDVHIDGAAWVDPIEQDFEPTPIERVERLLSRLPPRDVEILCRWWGLFDRPRETCGEIGRSLGLTKQAVWARANKALTRLRWQAERTEALRPPVGEWDGVVVPGGFQGLGDNGRTDDGSERCSSGCHGSAG